MHSTVTARPLTSASRPSPSCGLLPHASSSPAFATASAVQSAARTADTADGNNAAAASSPRHVQAASGVRERRITLKQARSVLVEHLRARQVHARRDRCLPNSSTSGVSTHNSPTITLISPLRIPLSKAPRHAFFPATTLRVIHHYPCTTYRSLDAVTNCPRSLL